MRALDALDIARFWLQAEKRDCGYKSLCWVWTGTCWSNGYAQFKLDGKNLLGHRVAWELVYGPTEELVCHRCDVRACIRPTHFFLGDHGGNLDDMARKGRSARHRSIIPPAMRARIIELYATGDYSQLEIARRFGLTQTTISQIVRKARTMQLQSRRKGGQ